MNRNITTKITLDRLLASRDHRWHKQMQLLRDHPNETLLCLTVVMPGSVKRNRLSLAVARAAMEAIRVEFGDSIIQMEERDLETGFEAYVLVSLPTLEAKQTACRIEENHPLGRLFDIDVIASDGTPLSRASVGAQPRRCLLCDNEARFCMRNRTHSPEQIQAHIAEIVEAYVHDGI